MEVDGGFIAALSESKWDQNDLHKLQRDAVSGAFRAFPSSRALAWRLFLDVLTTALPIEHWPDAIQAKRDQYTDLKNQLYPDFEKVSKEGDDPLSSLSAEGNGNDASGNEVGQGAWKRYYDGLELIEEIKRDLTRLYPSGVDEQHFMIPETQDIMLSVLFIWASLHKETSYRQGMHEVLAVIIYVLEQEAEGALLIESSSSTSSSQPLAFLLDSKYLEHDAFLLFDRLMLELEPLYSVQHGPSPGPGGSKREEAPVIRLCNRIQGGLLKRADPEVYRNLMRLEVTPQLYGIKWTRLLFAREFVMDDVLTLWDFMLATKQKSVGQHLEPIIEALGVAMIMAIRNHLSIDDVSGVLRQLMTYPQGQVQVARITALAESLHGGVNFDAHASSTSLSSSSSLSSSTNTTFTSVSEPSTSITSVSSSQAVPSWLKAISSSHLSSTSSKSSAASASSSTNAGPLRNFVPGFYVGKVGRAVAGAAGEVVDRVGSIADLNFLRREGSQSNQQQPQAAPPSSLSSSTQSTRPMNVMSKTGGGGQGGGSCSSNKDAQHVVPQGIGKLAQELQSAVLDLGERLGRVLESSKHPEVWASLSKVQKVSDTLNGRRSCASPPPTFHSAFTSSSSSPSISPSPPTTPASSSSPPSSPVNEQPLVDIIRQSPHPPSSTTTATTSSSRNFPPSSSSSVPSTSTMTTTTPGNGLAASNSKATSTINHSNNNPPSSLPTPTTTGTATPINSTDNTPSPLLSHTTTVATKKTPSSTSASALASLLDMTHGSKGSGGGGGGNGGKYGKNEDDLESSLWGDQPSLSPRRNGGRGKEAIDPRISALFS